MSSDVSEQQNTQQAAERREQWDRWVAAEEAEHRSKDHAFEPDRDFDEADVEGHGFCRGCS